MPALPALLLSLVSLALALYAIHLNRATRS